MSKKRAASPEVTEESLFEELAQFAQRVDVAKAQRAAEQRAAEQAAWNEILKTFRMEMRNAVASGRASFSFFVDELTEQQRNDMVEKINRIETLTAKWDAVSCRDSSTHMELCVSIRAKEN